MTIQRTFTVGSVTINLVDYVNWLPAFSYQPFDTGQLNLFQSTLLALAQSQPNLFAQNYTLEMALVPSFLQNNQGVGAHVQQTGPAGQHAIFWDPDGVAELGTSASAGFIDRNGNRVNFTLERYLAHELSHASLGFSDVTSGAYTLALTGGAITSNPDIVGQAVQYENSQYSVQRTDYVNSYGGAIAESALAPRVADFRARTSFTDQRGIDRTWHDNTGAAGNGSGEVLGIDTSQYVNSSGSGSRDLIFGYEGNDTIKSGIGADVVYGNWGNDQIDGGADNDLLFGGEDNDQFAAGQGDDVMFGGDLITYQTSTSEVDSIDYSKWDGFTTANTNGVAVNIGASFAGFDAHGYGWDGVHNVVVVDDGHGGTDRLISIEHIKLTDQSDTVAVFSAYALGQNNNLTIDGGGQPQGARDVLDLSATNGAVVKNPAVGGGGELYENGKPTGIIVTNFEDVLGSTFKDVLNFASMMPGGDPSPTDQAAIDAAWQTFRTATTATTGRISQAAYDAAKSTLISSLLATAPYQQTLTIDGAGGDDIIKGSSGQNLLIGGIGNDYLVGNGVFSDTMAGGDGNDLLIGDGIYSNLTGGAGQDSYVITNNSVVTATAEDLTYWAQMRLSGGVQQAWMENGFAYWTPATSLVAGALGAFGGVFAAASMLFDVITMTTFRYALSDTGNGTSALVVQFGRGHGGQAVIQNYSVDFDTGAATGGITVFKQLIGKATIADLKEYIKAALAAGGLSAVFNSDPLVLDLDGDGLELTRQTRGVYFEMDGDGFAEKTAWVKSDDAFLVRDLNANGTIDNLGEMFGNATTSGFAALKTYADSNNDNKINSLDTNWGQLKIWRDLDGDGVTDAGELQTLTAAGIKEISVASTTLTNQFIRGNSIRAEATFTRTDNTTSKIADVGLEVNETDTKYLGNSTISAPALALPELKGYGTVTGLRIAMTNKAALLTDVTNFKNLAATTAWPTLMSNAQGILYKWANVEGVAATSMGGGTFDRQKLAFLETYMGYELTPRVGGVPSEANLSTLIKSWNDIIEKETIRLAVQGPLKTMFSGLSYDAVKDRIVATTATGVADALKAAILTLSATAATAQTQWNTNWGPLFNELLDSTDRKDGNSVRADYTVQSLVKALDGTTTALTLTQFVTGLSLTGVQIGTSAANTLNRVDADGLQVYVGDGGNDTINGGYGQDVYVYGRNFGQDTITDIDSGDTGDRVRFAVFNAADLNFKRVGLDLVIEVKNSTDKITIKDQFETPEVSLGGISISADKGIEEIQFADGTIYEMGDVAAAVGLGTVASETLVGTGTADELEGLQGNDLLQGGDNGDTYYFGRGYGADIIQDVMTNPLLSAGDALVMLNGLSARDVSITRVGASDDVTLTIIGSPGDSVTIKDQFMYTPLGYQTAYAIDNRIEAIFFTMGASWSWTDLQAATIETYTTSGNDNTYGFGTADKFYASAGNDTLVGFDGGDTYYADRGTGNDTIWDQSRYPDSFIGTLLGYSWATDDKVVFASGITQADVSFTRLGAAADLTINIAGSTDTLTVKDQFKGEKLDLFGFFPITWFSRVEKFEFADGSFLTWEQVLQKITTGTAAAESLYGAYYTDTMDGKGGNDYLSGGDEGDTYLFRRGDGQDTIEDNQANVLTTTQDTLKFLTGISVADVTFTRTGTNGMDLLVSISGGTDSVLLKNEFDYLETGVFGTHFFDRVERFEWADGTVKDINTIVQQLIAGGKTTGNDTIYGTYGSETLDGGAGNDYLDGQAGSDIYIKNRNEGNDTIHETNLAHFTGDQDVVRFGTGIATTDLSFSRYGTNNWGLTITLNASGGSISIDDQFKFDIIGPNRSAIENFEFVGGTVWSQNDLRLQYLTKAKTTGADTIEGFFTNDTMDGGSGNDTLNGGNGSDIYLVGTGSGQDVITETTILRPETIDIDILQFGAGITAAQVAFSRAGNNLVLSWNSGTDTATITNQFLANGTWGSSWTDIEQIKFADGTTLTAVDAANRVIAALSTTGADTLNGSMYAERFDGGAGNDTLNGGGGGDTYVFKIGMGQDTINESVPDVYLNQPDTIEFAAGITRTSVVFSRPTSTNDLVATVGTDKVTIKNQFLNSNSKVEFFKFADGSVVAAAQAELFATTAQSTSGADTIAGTNGDDIIDGGAGNDTIAGGQGNDTFVFGRGSGQDTINDNTGYPGGNSWSDKIAFAADVRTTDLVLSRSGNNLIIGITGSTDQLTIVDQFKTTRQTTNNYDRIETFAFADGTNWTAADIDKTIIDQLTTAGAETIEAYDSNDEFQVSTGNDVLRGLDGSDTYNFARGSGADTIDDSPTALTSTDTVADKVVFGANVLATDLILARVGTGLGGVGSDLVIAISGTTDQLTIVGQLAAYNVDQNYFHRIETFTFDDGSSWTFRDIELALIKQATTAGNDTVLGFDSDDSFAMSSGNDVLKGLRGNDTYAFGRGAGQDTIDDNTYPTSGSAADTISFGPNVLTSDLVMMRSGDDLLITISGSTDQLRITGQFTSTKPSNLDRIEYFTFTDGTAWSAVDVDKKLIQQSSTTGNDTILGYDSGDELDGGTGNDLLKGAYGKDVYYFGRGDGSDTIDDGDAYEVSSAWSDTVSFKTGVSLGDLRFQRSGNDLVIQILGTTDQLRIVNQFQTTKRSGSNYDRIENFVFADGSSQTADQIDVLTLAQAATTGNDVITGFDSNDRLTGLAGDDTLDGATGSDTMEGGAGNDTYVVEVAGDTVFEEANNGIDTVSTNITYTLGANLENLVLTGGVLDNINGTGNAFDNVIVGNVGNNTLDGGAGTDTVSFINAGSFVTVSLAVTTAQANNSAAGSDIILNFENLTGSNFNDTLLGNAGNNVLEGGAGTDTLSYAAAAAGVTVSLALTGPQATGGAGTDTILNFENLTGSGFNDTLAGSSGNNVLNGGAGTDLLTYAGATAGITISLASTSAQATGGAGSDTISNFENLTGSAFDDVITGSTGNNVLDGGTAIDTVSFASSTTAVTASLAITTAQATGGGGSDTILNFENITGGTANDTLTGTSGNNVLNGGNGTDTLNGGLGNDTYVVNVTTDVVNEAAGAGTDTIISSATYTLNNTTQINIENLTLSTGTLPLGGTGHSGANVITGNAGSNILNGMLSNDTLAGGAGTDSFVFNTTLGAANVDAITDFSVIDDTIRLENTGAGLFTALITTGTLAAAAFWTGTAAHDADDRIIYNSANGDLWYDADGTGAAAAIRFATVSTGLALTNADFAVI